MTLRIEPVNKQAMTPIFRPLTPDDQPVVWEMLMHAAHEPSVESVQRQSALVRYAENWGRDGDLGLGAWANSQAIGAAWLRLWSGDDRGFGYVADGIPELAIAVIPQYQQRGVGTQLLTQLLKMVQSIYPAVSLNVRADNAALGLYQRLGFVKVNSSDFINRTGGVSFNMLYTFPVDDARH